MKFNFKKLASVATTAIMLSSTIAAAYPAPFVSNGVANAAVVYGANAALSDASAAIDLMNDLNSGVVSTGGTTTVTGGDSYKLEKSSTKFQLGNTMNGVVSVSVTDDDLPNLLADGKFIDDDNDEFDYTQKIRLADSQLAMFEDNDYKEDMPTVGFRIASGSNILNYTLDFSDEPTLGDLATSNLPFMGKDYYILSINSSAQPALTLLDSAVDTVLAEGETTTLNVGGASYEVAVNFIGSTPEVKLEVNGEVTNSLNEAETYKLSDGSYVGIKDILYNSKDTGISKVEFSIGSGKLVLTNGSDVELNDNAISNLGVIINAAGTLRDITIQWDADDDMFITEDSSITMPGFEAVKLSFGGMIYPIEETIKVDTSDTYITLKNFPLKDSTEDINILYGNGSKFVGIGKDATNLLKTANDTVLVFDADVDEYFVASWSDGSDAESYLMRATNFKTENAKNKTTIQYRKDGSWADAKSEAEDSDTVTVGNVEFTMGSGATGIHKDGKNMTITAANANVNFKTLYSKEGLKVYLPINTTLDAYAGAGAINFTNLTSTSFALVFDEEDKNDNIASGNMFNATLSWTTDRENEVSDVVGENATFTEIEDTDVWESYIYSALATKFLWNKPSSGRKTLDVIYHGSEAYGEVYLTAPDASLTSDSDAVKVVVVKDSEVSSVASKNLIVVGGSCINTVAATILGSESPICGEAFSAATNVAAGKYLIKTVASPLASDKVAMLVAGYDAEDTVDAVAKVKEGVDATVGTEQVYPMASA